MLITILNILTMDTNSNSEFQRLNSARTEIIRMIENARAFVESKQNINSYNGGFVRTEVRTAMELIARDYNNVRYMFRLIETGIFNVIKFDLNLLAGVGSLCIRNDNLEAFWVVMGIVIMYDNGPYTTGLVLVRWLSSASWEERHHDEVCGANCDHFACVGLTSIIAEIALKYYNLGETLARALAYNILDRATKFTPRLRSIACKIVIDAKMRREKGLISTKEVLGILEHLADKIAFSGDFDMMVWILRKIPDAGRVFKITPEIDEIPAEMATQLFRMNAPSITPLNCRDLPYHHGNVNNPMYINITMSNYWRNYSGRGIPPITIPRHIADQHDAVARAVRKTFWDLPRAYLADVLIVIVLEYHGW